MKRPHYSDKIIIMRYVKKFYIDKSNTDRMNIKESHEMQLFHVQAETYILTAPKTPV